LRYKLHGSGSTRYQEDGMRLWLKMCILGKFGRQREFAKAIKKPETWLSMVINSRLNPTKVEKEIIADALDVQEIEGLFIEQSK